MQFIKLYIFAVFLLLFLVSKKRKIAVIKERIDESVPRIILFKLKNKNVND